MQKAREKYREDEIILPGHYSGRALRFAMLTLDKIKPNDTMPSTSSNINIDAINMDDLEEGCAATSPPHPSPNRSSAVASLRDSARTATKTNQPCAALEVAAAAAAAAFTAPAAVSSAINGSTGPELGDDACGLPLPMGMMEEGFAERSSAITTKSPPSMGPTAVHHSAAAASFGVSARPSGLESMDDNDGLSFSTGMDDLENHNKGKKRGAVGIIEDGAGPGAPLASYEQMDTKTNLVNELSPPTPFNLKEDLDDEEKKKPSMPSDADSIIFPGDINAKEINLVNELSPPTPSNPSTLEDVDADEKKKASMPSGRDSIIVPTREDIEDEDQPLTSTRLPSNNNNRPYTLDVFHAGPVNTNLHVEEEEMIDNDLYFDEEEGRNGEDYNETNNIEGGAAIRPALEQDHSTPVIPEAFLVEERSDDGMVVHGHAEPLLPWYKQRRTKLLIDAFIVILVILAVSLGVPLSRKAPAIENLILGSDAPSESPTEKPSDAPSTTTSPSDHHSDSPSTSPVPTAVPTTKPSITPSYSPSACVNQISSNAQKIDLQIDDPDDLRVAVDGKDMVIVFQQGWNTVFLIFFKFANGGWQKIKTFQVDGLGGLVSFDNVALSGNTAFVGFLFANDDTGAVLIYQKDQYGDWNVMEDPFVHDASATHRQFGMRVDIGGNLACVEDSYGAYLYHRENNKWVQLDSIIGGRMCSIAGDTIVTTDWDNNLQLYRYNQELKGIFPIQDSILTGAISELELSRDYLVYWDSFEEDAFMYRREDTNQTFVFHQQLNSSSAGTFIDQLAFDNDILVVRGIDKTHIFTEQTNGKWEETITLDQSYYSYALSGRSLIATTRSDEVYYFDIEGCSQAMPTQTPSLSTAPSDSPSSSPTLLQCIEVAITYGNDPSETWRHLYRVVGEDWTQNELIQSHQGSEGDTSFVQTLCLQEAEYIFTIRDWGDGICCNNGEGNYNVTSNGMLIVKGGEFEFQELTTFSIPFISHPPSISPSLSPTMTPTLSSSPSMSTSPTLAPSSSSSPTETCCGSRIRVAISYDRYPEETYWYLYRVVGGDDYELVKEHEASEGDTSHVESFCLQEGEYIFTIGDFGGGICCDRGEGNYNVTSDGMLIVEGGEFGYLESTPFSIPFISHPPSTSPSTTSSPSSSSPPTLLQCIQIVITYDQNPLATYWQLDRVVGDGVYESVKAHSGSEGDTSYVESICLQEGEYIFGINNGDWDGRFYGNYNVTSNGMLIVEGGGFETSEETPFSIPFVPSGE